MQSDPTSNFDHTLRFFQDSDPFFPSSLGDAQFLDSIDGYPWWEWDLTLEPNQVDTHVIPAASLDNSKNANEGITSVVVTPDSSLLLDHPRSPSATRKRCATDGEPLAVKKSAANKRRASKSKANEKDNNNEKDKRWAEQLLNSCAAAFMAGNASRVEHFLCVLHELASSTGDANRRLAAHGLRALYHFVSLSHITSTSSSAVPVLTFPNIEPKLFQQSLLKFNEVSPWFAFPNHVANSSILQLFAQEPHGKDLHILDIGVSHGMQWPTLLEALTHTGTPPRVRITIVAVTSEYDQNQETLFCLGPSVHSYSAQIQSFAKSLNVDLEIKELRDSALLNLREHITTPSDETLIICAQFRLNHIYHEERTNFFKMLHGLEPRGVVLCENDMECTCSGCADFATGFSRRAENLWSFLDSTNSAFIGQNCGERRVIEGEAAKVLTSRSQMNEPKAKWFERMEEVGFVIEEFKEDAIEGARSLLRKYDSRWEMRMEERDRSVGLWWKGQPVSFCSLWTISKERRYD